MGDVFGLVDERFFSGAQVDEWDWHDRLTWNYPCW
jgi:hypothetical protein